MTGDLNDMCEENGVGLGRGGPFGGIVITRSESFDICSSERGPFGGIVITRSESFDIYFGETAVLGTYVITCPQKLHI